MEAAPATKPLTITEDNFEQFVTQDGIAVIDWWAPWCAPCRMFAPVLDKAAVNHPQMRFGKVNTDEQRSLSAAFDIQSIPTLMIFRDHILLFSQPGALPASAFEDLLSQVQKLDMDEVRRKVAEKQQDKASA